MRRKLIMIFTIVLSTALVASVFFRYGSKDVRHVVEQLGGVVISDEKVRVNGVDGSWQIYGIMGDSDFVAERLSVLGGEVEPGAMARWKRENETILFLPIAERSLIFVFSADSSKNPSLEYPESLPYLSGLKLTFTAEKRNISFMSGTLPDGVGEAQRRCRETLENAGFYELVHGGMVFVKGKNTIAVGVTESTSALRGVDLVMLRQERQVK